MIAYPFTNLGVEQALTALGTTPNAIATNLSAFGFRGVVGSECRCPVAAYLLASFDGATAVGVYLDTEEAFADVWTKTDGVSTSVMADLPAPVIGFVARFDKREYPDLIEESSHGA